MTVEQAAAELTALLLPQVTALERAVVARDEVYLRIDYGTAGIVAILESGSSQKACKYTLSALAPRPHKWDDKKYIWELSDIARAARRILADKTAKQDKYESRYASYVRRNKKKPKIGIWQDAVLLKDNSHIPAIAYRTEDYSGSGVIDIETVLDYEINARGNQAIIDDMLRQGLITQKELPDNRRDPRFISAVTDSLQATTGRNLRYCLWLGRKYDVLDYYTAPGNTIDSYRTISDNTADAGLYVLQDRGEAGFLCAYTEKPGKLARQKA